MRVGGKWLHWNERPGRILDPHQDPPVISPGRVPGAGSEAEEWGTDISLILSCYFTFYSQKNYIIIESYFKVNKYFRQIDCRQMTKLCTRRKCLVRQTRPPGTEP